MAKDSILLDDDLEIMIIPHMNREKRWLSYDEIDKMRQTFPRFPSMLYNFNSMESWRKRIERKIREEIGEDI